jgi:hypothetical protein
VILLACCRAESIQGVVTHWCAPRALGSPGYDDPDLSDLFVCPKFDLLSIRVLMGRLIP